MRENYILKLSKMDLSGVPMYFLVSPDIGLISDERKTLQNLKRLQQNIEQYIPVFHLFGILYVPELNVFQFNDLDVRKGG